MEHKLFIESVGGCAYRTLSRVLEKLEISKHEEILIEDAQNILVFSEGLAKCETQEGEGYIDKNGNIII